MVDGTVLRVFTFRPVGSDAALDATLRDDVLPALLASPSLLDALVGRHDAADEDERVVASVWQSREAMTAELGESSLVAPFRPEQAGSISDGRLDVLPVAVSVRVERAEPPSILRVFRGEAREGQLDLYVDEARVGAGADAAANKGLVALYLGIDPPSRFVTVSAWTDWGAIERATGGNVRQPIATRNSLRIVTGTAEHYEILPSTARPPVHFNASEAAG